MWNRTLIIGVIILTLALAGLWLCEYRNLPQEPDTVILKNGSLVKGEIVKQEFGKYIVIEKIDNTRQVLVWEQVQDITLFNPPWYLRTGEMMEGVLKFGVIGGIFVFAIGLWQYRVAQKWERAKFLLDKIGQFESNKYVTNARIMIEYNGRPIYVHGDAKAPVVVTNELLASALRRPAAGTEFSEDEQVIRDTFDVYLSYLDEFDNFLVAGLVKKSELKIYLEYWLKILGDPGNTKLSQDARRRLWDYMHTNDFHSAVHLLRRYGYTTTLQEGAPKRGGLDDMNSDSSPPTESGGPSTDSTS